MAPVAYMLGARAFEKHFTLNHAWKGTDHAYSLMPDGMRRFVRDLHRIPAALGDGVKRRLPSEERPLEKMGRSSSPRGISRPDTSSSPATSSPSRLPTAASPVRARRAARARLVNALRADEDITLEDVEPAGELAARGAQQA